MAKEGAQVIICSRKKSNVDAAIKKISEAGGKVEGFAINVGNKADRDQLIDHVQKKYGKLDVLVPNAAVSTHFGNQFEISEKAYDKLWDLNVKSTFFIIKECLPLLKIAGKGSNVCIISSVTGKNPSWTIGVYGSTKAALDNMVRWMADELMSDGIRVTGLAPGLI